MTDKARVFLELSPEWRDAIERRVEAIVSGKTKMIPAADALTLLRRERATEQQERGEARSG